jgi:hypothetical protein
MQAIERCERPVVPGFVPRIVCAIVGGRLGEPRRFRDGDRGGILPLVLLGMVLGVVLGVRALAAMEMRGGADLRRRVGERRPR